MTKAEFSKMSGWAFIAASFAFITILSNSDPLAIPGSVISTFLLATGMLGLRARYGERAGSLGRNMLLLGMLGPILWVIAIASMPFMNSSRNLIITQMEKGLWILIFVGPAITLLGLTLFGLAALRSKPMPRMNWLPILAGIWYPAVYSFLFVYLISHNGVLPEQYWSAVKFTFVIQFLALCLLGFILVIDSPKELATT
jgi:hypothetical protein